MSIRLLICDDHEVIRTGLASLLAGTDIQIVGEAANGKDALRLAQKDKPDVILLDIRMPDGDGLSTLEKLRAKVPESKVVMLSTYDNPTYIARAVALGAADYVLKGSSREDLIATITAAAAGESPSRSGELKKIAGAMKVRQVIDDDDVPLDPARDASAAARGPGAEQPGDRQVAGDQRRDGQGARAEHPAEDRRQRPHPGRGLGRAQGIGLRDRGDAFARIVIWPAGALSRRLAQRRGADVRVDLRGHQALVAQQFLHAADIGAAVQQMGGETVPQRVRRRAAVQAGELQILFQHPGDASRGEAPPELVDEHRAAAPAQGSPAGRPAGLAKPVLLSSCRTPASARRGWRRSRRGPAVRGGPCRGRAARRRRNPGRRRPGPPPR